jgi:hypothetical protein
MNEKSEKVAIRPSPKPLVISSPQSAMPLYLFYLMPKPWSLIQSKLAPLIPLPVCRNQTVNKLESRLSMFNERHNSADLPLNHGHAYREEITGVLRHLKFEYSPPIAQQ